MSVHPVPVSALQRLWLKEMGVGRWQLPEPLPAKPSAELAAVSSASGAKLARVAASAAAEALRGARPAGARVLSAPSSGVSTKQQAVPARPLVATSSAQTLASPPIVVPAGDITALREQVLACEACQLCQTRRQAVFGEGAVPARWMVIGEAPGEQEDRQGSPFVGRAGQLLDAMLMAVGLVRGREVFVANVIKCRPPANRNPRPEEIAACSPYLRRQIELVRPAGLLVLGRFAAHTLLQTDAPIAGLRGRVHEWRGESGWRLPLVVSYHPAYLLRSPHAKAAAWQDLRLALAQPV